MALLLALARAKRGVQLKPLYEKLGWSWRNAYRDLETLRAAGVPVDSQEHGWYSVGEQWIPPGVVNVARDELAALSFARRLAPGLKNTLVGRALDSLWAKLSATGRQPPLALGADAWLHVRAPGAIDYGPHRLVVDTIWDALDKRRALDIHYRKLDGVDSRRTIEPAFMQWDPVAETLYVRAWCRSRGELRTFAVHRIQSATLTGDEFPPHRSAVTEAATAFRLWARPGIEHVVLRFSPAVAGEVRERCWHASQRFSDCSDGSIVLELDVAAAQELERLLLGYGPDVEVVEPASLAARVRDRHRAAAGPRRAGMIRAKRARRSNQAAPSSERKAT